MALRQFKNALQEYKYICKNVFDINRYCFNFLIIKDLYKNIAHNNYN